MKGFIRRPAVHFVALGTLLWALSALRPQPDVRPTVILSSTDVERLRHGFVERWDQPPNDAQLQALIQEEIDGRILVSEARRLGLDIDDRAVSQRLVSKMRAVAEDPSLSPDELQRLALDLGLDDDLVVDRLLRQKMRVLLRRNPQAPPVTHDELQAALERYRGRFVKPARATFHHVFLSASLHGSNLEMHAAATASRLPLKDPREASRLSDPFPLASHVKGSSRNDIARRFGSEFADRVTALEPGRWSPSPLRSPFGLHWVWVEEKLDDRLPDIDEIRAQLLPLVEAERAEARLRSELARLRQSYDIQIETQTLRLAEIQP